MRKICIVTGTRAEYGLLRNLMSLIKDSNETKLQIIATNMHLSPKYGDTYKEIEFDGFNIDIKVPIIDSDDDSSQSILISMSKAIEGIAQAFDNLKPDLLVVLGDRYEILAAAEAALIMRIPIAHISGGDITEGAYDDAIRHSITKMSLLHFPSTELYRQRIIQMGESPERVFNVGSTGVENIKNINLLSKKEIENLINFQIDSKTILVTYHPVTLGSNSSEVYITEFLSALDAKKDLKIIFTMPNSDNGRDKIADAINNFVKQNPKRAKSFKSLGVVNYLSLMQYVAAVVGNSSSGIIETPSFGIPTLNIGDRQKGRLAAESVYNCTPDKESIIKGFDYIMSDKFRKIAKTVKNPYYKPNSSKNIFQIIKSYPLTTKKHFFERP